ncbi:flagellar basal body P-ring formation chaperone FlgA [Sulfuricurvum sp.]|uniref:flagellar basal body P-ring formation chaperone FlgA n=1 Tax=Sulfuricurvum sp. TaxID=2025608 RepID=UPI003BAE2318
MKILLLLFAFFLHLNAFELQENYEFEDPVIHSQDLFPNIPKSFEILKIPEGKTQYRIDAQVIAKTFELNGIIIELGKTRFVNFTKRSAVDFSTLKLQLELMLIRKYPSIQIDEITILPRGYLESLGKETRGVFDERFYQHPKGTFYILTREGVRRYLDYSVQATLPVLHTNQKVSRKEPLSGFNTILKPIPLQTFKDKPLTSLPDHPSRFRSVLKAGQVLTLRNIEEVPMVLKNEKVIVEVRNGMVVVEFVATATQEGLLYDIITIQKSDGKRAKAKVTGEKRVELQ